MPIQAQVPQFVDVEDRIFGPLTAKQFLMFVMATLIIAGFYVALPLYLTVTLAIPVVVFTLLLAFYKVNGRSFIWFLYAVVHFLFTGKLFLWERRGETPKVRISSAAAVVATLERRGMRVPGRLPVTGARIQRLAQLLDTAGKVVNEDLPTPQAFEKV